MRILHISSADNKGGGARSAYRLHRSLIEQGIESRMYVKNKFTNDESVIKFVAENSLKNRFLFSLRRRWETGNVGYFTVNNSLHIGFAPPTSPFGLAPLSQIPETDLVNFHWIAGFWDFRLLPFLASKSKAIVWRLSDMNPFTGGCFVDNDCNRFTKSCGRCPCLHSKKKNDLSRRSLSLKKHIIKALPKGFIHLVAQSRWIQEKIQSSAVFGGLPVTRIPNGINTQQFRPRNTREARAEFGIQEDHSVILFVAQSLSNPVKGSSFFAEAIGRVVENFKSPITVVALGQDDFPIIEDVCIIKMNIEDDEKLTLAYSAADVFVITSLQDNFPNTVLESMACGTPVVGFAVGGIPDMVIDGETGFLAPVKDTGALAQKIIEIISNKNLRSHLSDKCREHITMKFSLEMQTKSYITLYDELLA